MYNFSAPMPYSIEDIDKILDINKQVEKSKITSLYACVPRGCEVFTGFEQSRNFAFDNVSWDYWKGLIEYVLNQGCDFIYLLNSPRPLDIENPDFPKQLEKLELLLTELRKLGVNKLRVASGQLMTYIGKHYSDFQVLASTSLEYKTIWEYQNFINYHPEVKQIVPSHDVNKNFLLLKNLRKKYPKMELELMVNEGCLLGCPNRMFHQLINIDKYTIQHYDEYLSGAYATSFCRSILHKFPIACLVISSYIFPWDIKEYVKIGINHFKLVGRDGYGSIEKYKIGYSMYLKGIDDIRRIEKYSIAAFTHHLKNNIILQQLTVKDFIQFLPNIRHFIKYGHLCSSRCALQCKYCYRCAEKIQKLFEKRIDERKKIPHYISSCEI